MTTNDYKRLKGLNLEEKKELLIKVTKKMQYNEDKTELDALSSIQYNLESDIKDLQITSILDSLV